MLEKVSFSYKNKQFEIMVKNCNLFEKFFGLMFIRKRKAQALLFEFKKPTKIKIHSFFVFFPFVAIWLDRENKIIDFKIIKPFNLAISHKKQFKRLVEIPINERYSGIVKLLVGD